MSSVNWDKLERIRELETETFNRDFAQLDTRYVPGEGGDNPLAMIIGEAPGAEESMQRRPFVGPCRVVRDLMGTAGLWVDPISAVNNSARVNCWLTNTVKFRPPGNRTPTSEEVETAKAFLRAEWHAIGRPRFVVTVGLVATRAVIGGNAQMQRISGSRVMGIASDGKPLWVFPMYHPAYGLRNESARHVIETHWLRLGEFIDRYQG